MVGFNFPVVPKGGLFRCSIIQSLLTFICLVSGKARIRVQLSAVHDKSHIDRCIEAFVEVGKNKGII